MKHRTSPLLMGALNITPDSFYEQSRYFVLEHAIERGMEMIREGVDIVDIGGVSTRPGAASVKEGEEMLRVIPIIEALSGKIPISIDTYNVAVAKCAVEKGATIINDITGFTNPEMQELAATCSADLCVMHMQGSPQTMQINPFYPEGVIEHIMLFFDRQIRALVSRGVHESRIILDPGIGFGKTIKHNLTILQNIDRFKTFGLRLLVGASRKWFLQQILGKPAREVLTATLVVHAQCVTKGVDIIRAHDIREHREALDILKTLT